MNVLYICYCGTVVSFSGWCFNQTIYMHRTPSMPSTSLCMLSPIPSDLHPNFSSISIMLQVNKKEIYPVCSYSTIVLYHILPDCLFLECLGNSFMKRLDSVSKSVLHPSCKLTLFAQNMEMCFYNIGAIPNTRKNVQSFLIFS